MHSYRWCSMVLHDYILAIAIHKTVTTSVWAAHHPDDIHTLHRHSLYLMCHVSSNYPHSPLAVMSVPITLSFLAVGWWDRASSSSCRLTDPVDGLNKRARLSRDG